MDAKKISCVVVALMFLSVSCFAALNPNDSENATGDAPILATKGERDLMSIEAMETLEHT